MSIFGDKSVKTVVIVHLDAEGNKITALQRSQEPQYIINDKGTYPKWLHERVALLKIAEEGTVIIGIRAIKVNPSYFMLRLSKKEHAEIGQILGT